MKHSAIILRVQGTAARNIFPFDKVYFFKREEIPPLSRIFRHALVIFPNYTFVNILDRAIKLFGWVSGKAFPVSRWDEEKLKEKIKEHNPLADILVNHTKYMAVIPILFLRLMEEEKIAPAYLYTRMITLEKKRLLRKVMSDSYFLSDGEEFRPICSICTNSLELFAGKCLFGSSKCMKSLLQTKPSEFMKNIRRYRAWANQLDEPAISLEKGNE